MKNIKLVQALMSLTGDLFDFQYYVIENFFYWKSKEKTLLMLNMMLVGAVGMLPLVFIPKRYLIVGGLWGAVASNSPFFMAIFMAVA